MELKHDWEKIIKRMERLMRLKAFPVAVKMLEKAEELDTIPFLRRVDKKATLCQLIAQVKNFDWTVGAKADDFLISTCPSIIGLADIPETHKDGTFRSIIWTSTKEEGSKYEAGIPRLPMGRYKAIAMAPLVYKPFDPDIVLIYANPAQIMLLINALQFYDYEVMEFYCVGESSCSDAIARCYLTGKPSLSIPCYGERRYGHAQDDEMVMAVPADKMNKALKGLEALYRRGVRYPISYAGAELDTAPAFPVSYKTLDNIMARIKGDDNRLLLGVTGSIACGKSTVTQMLENLGAPLINFDTIARQVVEPGQPALDEIVETFGRNVLLEDGSLDRKKMSSIVFGDFEKRKKLESITHPQIYESFFQQVNEIAAKKTDPIIQVEIPLLIELNFQYMFDRLMVVHITEELQVKRLAERDGINEEGAANILKSQLPVSEKIGFAQYVINNSGDLKDTEKQIIQAWESIVMYQKSRLTSSA